MSGSETPTQIHWVESMVLIERWAVGFNVFVLTGMLDNWSVCYFVNSCYFPDLWPNEYIYSDKWFTVAGQKSEKDLTLHIET